MSRARRWDGAGHVLLTALSGVGLVLFPGLILMSGGWGFDTWAYAHVDLAAPYRFDADLDSLGAFRYSPPLAIAFALVGLVLPWPAFLYAWTALLLGCVGFLGRRRYTLALLGLPVVALDLHFGNVNLLLAAAIAVAGRYPAAWALVLLAKPTCGIALAWHLARREWRPVAVAVGVTAAIAVPTILLRPDLWAGWVAMLAGNLEVAQPVPRLPRLIVAGAVAVLGGRAGRPWAMPLAAAIAVPSIWLNQLSLFAAIVPSLLGGREDRWPWQRAAGPSPAGAS